MAVSFVAYKGKWPRYCGWLLSWRNSLIPLIVIYPNFSPLRGPSDRRPERDGKTAWVRAYKASHVYPLKGNLCPVNNLSPSPTKVARFFSYLYDRDPLQRGSKIRETAPFKFSSQSSDRFILLLQLLFLRFSFFFLYFKRKRRLRSTISSKLHYPSRLPFTAAHERYTRAFVATRKAAT